MIKLSDNIISPLGSSTADNYLAVKNFRSELRKYSGRWGLPEPFTASLFSDSQRASYMLDGFSEFESLAISSIRRAMEGLDLSGSRNILILSTTKAEAGSLKSSDERPENLYPGIVARRISRAAGIDTDPIVVCNACISGVSAVILAQRLLDSDAFDHAIVCGIDLMSPFIVSGFQSFKALSPEPCRPFDMDRLGLTLGESAATIVFGRDNGSAEGWRITKGAVRNDAFHISAPSGKGDGAFLALKSVTEGVPSNRIAFINAHGTATMFNDRMEAAAIRRAGLTDTPVNAFKGCYGHTMGACGVLETILCMASLDDGTVIGTKGFGELGVSGGISVSSENRAAHGDSFVKMISGFGGCNAAVLASKSLSSCPEKPSVEKTVTHHVSIFPDSVSVDGRSVSTSKTGYAMLTEVFKSFGIDYPKFYKMDPLSRLGFVASELLARAEGGSESNFREDRAVMLFNRSSSLAADRKYLNSIEDRNNFFPSPSLFVYTLPNIVNGEIAIRNRYRGETSFYILPEKNEAVMSLVLDAAAMDPVTRSAVSGWVDFEDELHFNAEMSIFRILK